MILNKGNIIDCYRDDLDALKGIAIIAIILYHIGIVPNGYLGVDTFLILNGFFIIPNLCTNIINGTFVYFGFLKRRLYRLMPLVLFASLACLVTGYFGMLPDDYENLSESVFATNFCSNNILSALTIKDYWSISNDYKPLMHTWYIGILVQFYIIFPLLVKCIVYIARRMNLNVRKAINILLSILFVASLFLYLNPNITYYIKFYHLPFRLFEFCAGGFLGIILSNNPQLTISRILRNAAWVGLFICYFYYLNNFNSASKIIPVGANPEEFQNSTIEYRSLFLIITLIFSSLLLFKSKKVSLLENLISNKFSQYIGKLSLSIFIWHQIIIAFKRYYINNEFSLFVIIAILVCTVLISILTYTYIENRKPTKKRIFLYSTIFVITTFSSLHIYNRAGVVRDVPELNITCETPFVNRNTEYIDQIYNSYREFHNDDKIQVLVIGNSFARDFACILNESEYADSISLYYSPWILNSIEEHIRNCDFIFSFSSKKDIPQYLWKNIKPAAQVWGIGTKNYGESNGPIYRNRNSEDYYNQTVPLNQNYAKLNSRWSKEWGENYINFIEMSTTPNGQIRIFTDDNKFISQDCQHLTQSGAKFYASIINFSKIFNIHR